VKESISPPTRRELLLADLRRRISEKEFLPGQPFPSQNELSLESGLSTTTVREALSALEHEGFIIRTQGRRAVVAEPPLHIPRSRTVAMVIKAHGHVFGSMAARLSSSLRKRGFYPLLVSMDDGEVALRQLEEVLQTRPGFVVVEGAENSPFFRIEKSLLANSRLIFVDRFLGADCYRADYVLSDYVSGGYLATRHLLALGHRRILFLGGSRKFMREEPVPPIMDSRHRMVGCGRAIAEWPIPEELKIEFISAEDGCPSRFEAACEKLFDIFSRDERPTGVAVYGDSNVPSLYMVLNELGLRTPQDVCVIGYYNTPWCDVLHPSLTSVSIEELRIAETAAEIVAERALNPGLPPRTVFVEQRLVFRDSCPPLGSEQSESKSRGET